MSCIPNHSRCSLATLISQVYFVFSDHAPELCKANGVYKICQCLPARSYGLSLMWFENFKNRLEFDLSNPKDYLETTYKTLLISENCILPKTNNTEQHLRVKLFGNLSWNLIQFWSEPVLECDGLRLPPCGYKAKWQKQTSFGRTLLYWCFLLTTLSQDLWPLMRFCHASIFLESIHCLN